MCGSKNEEESRKEQHSGRDQITGLKAAKEPLHKFPIGTLLALKNEAEGAFSADVGGSVEF
jgi:hypothetical protein